MILKIHITLFLAVLYNLYIGKKRIFFIAYLFIIMHELCHMIVALLLDVDILEINLLPFGATAKYSGKLTLIKELLISIAGPIGTLFFAYIYRNETYFIVNILILIFNLIPIYPLDGGRIVKVLVVFLFGHKNGKKIFININVFLIFLLFLLSVYFLIKYKNISLILLSLYTYKFYKEEMEKEKILSIINYLQIN